MHLKDHDLFQIDEESIRKLGAKDSEALTKLTINLLEDLVEARNRLNQNPSNSSRPSGSMPPWESGKTDTEKKQNLPVMATSKMLTMTIEQIATPHQSYHQPQKPMRAITPPAQNPPKCPVVNQDHKASDARRS